MSMISVREARERILTGVAPLDATVVDIEAAAGRILADDLAACHDQPPFAASSMDGYAVRADDLAAEGKNTLRLIGEAAAGHPFAGHVSPGEAVRIFTGAALPCGCDSVVAQEDVTVEGAKTSNTFTKDRIRFSAPVRKGRFVRPRAMDFARDQTLLSAGTLLAARSLTLAAAMGYGRLGVRRRPRVAILATGDELVAPGIPPDEGQIVSSIPVGLARLTEAFGGVPQYLGIARDSLADLETKLRQAEGADILVTIGGASVGDHDLVQKALRQAGCEMDFWRIAMRPGKPLMFARRARQYVLGVPGNPVSALVCGRLFLVPLMARLLGRPGDLVAVRAGQAGAAIEANGAREHYMRARIAGFGDLGQAILEVFDDQDSSLMSLLNQADALVVRPPHAPPVQANTPVTYLPIDF